MVFTFLCWASVHSECFSPFNFTMVRPSRLSGRAAVGVQNKRASISGLGFVIVKVVVIASEKWHESESFKS